MPFPMGLMDLARHLRQEFLFVSSERQNLQNLNEKVLKTTEKLYHLSWITRQQRVNFDNLMLSHRDENPATLCQHANLLEAATFVDSYKQLGIHDTAYAEFLQHLREHPKLLAMCLNAGEHINIEVMHRAVGVVMSSLYGNCILPEDENFILTLLKELMSLQLSVSDNPRRLLRHGSCAFSRVYKTFNECLFSAKIFLTAALYEPIMHVLMDDDLFLDIDPSKAAVRFPPQERLRHFGKEGTQEYAANLQRHRNWTINKLFNLTMRFIEGIRNNLCCFPQSLSWLARQMYNSVIKAKRVEVKEVGAMCADLVFAFFICPAIVNPVPYGITDIHISDIARFNLMQVAQILQVLAMSKWEEIDPKLMDLYGRFEKDAMSSLLDLILDGSTTESDANLVNQFQDMSRSAILITEAELISLVTFLRSVESETREDELKKMLFPITNPLPVVSMSSVYQNGDGLPGTPAINSVDGHSAQSKKGFLGKVGKKSSKHSSNSVSPGDNYSEDSFNNDEGDNVSMTKNKLEDVLVIPIPGMEFDCPGMLNENKVLAIDTQKRHQPHKSDQIRIDDNDVINCLPEITEKKTRFILSQDQESLGTSDNLEAISEGASNQSVASSVDLENENDENENDNLSDMVSANVSGRGTPNVSGRDTPLSQLDGEDRPIDLVTGSRKTQEDMEDKFGKFEIQPLTEGDEAKSMVSDTWSTDVLASDSEMLEQSDISLHLTTEQQNLAALDASETASQSDAWSTDVLASDTERLLDVDTDDTASVARSDDTGRSEVFGDIPPSLDITPVDDLSSGGPDYRMFMSQRYSGSFLSDHSKSGLVGLQEDAEDDQDVFIDKDKNMDGDRTSNSSGFASEPGCFKPLDSLSDDLIHVGPDINCSQTHLNDSLNSMQSLGRVSLAIREMSNENQDSGSLLLDSLQETVTQQNDRSSHRSSIADILSLDLTRTLNLQAEMISTDDSLPKSASMEIEKDALTDNPGPPLRKGEVPRMKSPTFVERGSKRKLVDSGEDCNIRSSAASNTSSASSTGSYEAKMPAESGLESGSKSSGMAHSHGAIPKSISFDKAVHSSDNSTADDKYGSEKNKKGLFKFSGFRINFKGRNRKSHIPPYIKGSDELLGGKNSRQSQESYAELRALQLEAGDEILAKYRKKSPSVGSTSTLRDTDSIEQSYNVSDTLLMDNSNEPFDAVSVENTIAFYNAKHKIRLVLGSADLQTLPWQSSIRAISNQRFQDNELVAFLKVLLAEAINLQQRPLLSHLREALRCVQMLDDVSCQKLFRSLREDYKRRTPYITYLVRCRQGLLCTLSHLETLIERIERDKQVCNHNLVMLCTRTFLERWERPRQMFIKRFMELTVSDEKALLIQNFLTFLFNRMECDIVWQTANENQIEHAQVIIERIVMGQIYTSALHPNGDGDVLRDKVLQEHMQKLSQVITPNHKDLRIPKQFHSECPWPSAQAELDLINAYKTPRDKIQCVVRCCSTIMNLLSISSEKGVPAADDLMPVLVYVLIKANPTNMLSTVQYVNTFYEKHLEGEEAYWWTQFCCGVEFIKTMDY